MAYRADKTAHDFSVMNDETNTNREKSTSRVLEGSRSADKAGQDLRSCKGLGPVFILCVLQGLLERPLQGFQSCLRCCACNTKQLGMERSERMPNR